MMATRVWIVSALLLLLVVMDTRAENRVENPGFDIDLAGWTNNPVWPAVWVGNEGYLALGAARGTMTSSGSSIGTIVLKQCVPVQGDLAYSFAGAFMEDPTSTQTGGGRLRIDWHEVVSCASAGSVGVQLDPVSGVAGWQDLFVEDVVSPALALSASVLLIQAIDAAGDYSAFWDDLLLEPTGEIFSDGFESGDALDWD